MNLAAILAGLRRNATGAVLITVQIAITLAIVCNALSVIQQRLERMQRATGIDEANIFTLDTRWLGQETDPATMIARNRADLDALRALPGVIDVVATGAVPLKRGNEDGWVSTKPDQKPPTTWTGIYNLDEHGLAAFGSLLSSGRWFEPQEVNFVPTSSQPVPPVAVVSKALAAALFPGRAALGRQFYYVNSPVRIIGILDRLQAGFEPLSWAEPYVENSLIFPWPAFGDRISYVVRTGPGRQGAVMRAAPGALLAVNRARIIDQVEPFSVIRATAYHDARALSLTLGTVSGLLLLVTALGVVGLTSYWVGQRRHQIGVRRALGARRSDILRQFHTENLLLGGLGAVIGAALALMLNLWVARGLQIAPMSVGLAVLAAAIVLTLCQAAVLWPALRAASIPPAIAARGG